MLCLDFQRTSVLSHIGFGEGFTSLRNGKVVVIWAIESELNGGVYRDCFFVFEGAGRWSHTCNPNP